MELITLASISSPQIPATWS